MEAVGDCLFSGGKGLHQLLNGAGAVRVERHVDQLPVLTGTLDDLRTTYDHVLN